MRKLFTILLFMSFFSHGEGASRRIDFLDEKANDALAGKNASMIMGLAHIHALKQIGLGIGGESKEVFEAFKESQEALFSFIERTPILSLTFKRNFFSTIEESFLAAGGLKADRILSKALSLPKEEAAAFRDEQWNMYKNLLIEYTETLRDTLESMQALLGGNPKSGSEKK